MPRHGHAGIGTIGEHVTEVQNSVFIESKVGQD